MVYYILYMALSMALFQVLLKGIPILGTSSSDRHVYAACSTFENRSFGQICEKNISKIGYFGYFMVLLVKIYWIRLKTNISNSHYVIFKAISKN